MKKETMENPSPIRVLMKIYDENLNRLNHVVKISHFPFVIGRSAQNDYIIDHPSVSSEHFTFIEEDEQIFMVNHSHTNGLLVKGQKHERILVSTPQIVMVGGVKVEVISLLAEKLEKTREIFLRDLLEREESPQENLAKSLGAMVFFVICLGCKRFFTDPLTVGGTWSFGKETLTGFFWILGLTLIQALFCKLQTQDYQFLSLFKNICKAAGILVLIKFLLPLGCFYAGISSFQNLIEILLNLLVLCYFLGRYLQVVFLKQYHRRLWAALAVILMIYGIAQGLLLGGQDEWGENDYQGQVAYPGNRFMEETPRFKDLQKDLDQSFKKLQTKIESNGENEENEVDEK